MAWKRAHGGNLALKTAAADAPGWYWIYRPQNEGRRSYDAGHGVLCMVYLGGDGSLLSPLADMRSLDADGVTCFNQSTGEHFDTWFSGPVQPGAYEGTVRAQLTPDGVAPQVRGRQPGVPGWAWCKTNNEAPLLLVDQTGIGPVFLAPDVAGTTQVYLAADGQGNSVDVGEFGFAEPLVSEGGVIDASGELGRVEAQFFGAIPVPEALPAGFPVLQG